MSQLFVISDTHFGHANILDYEPVRRAWCMDIESHDREIIAAWRATVAPTDTVIHCGDFALGHKECAVAILAQLTGRIQIVLGNHDRGLIAMAAIGFFNPRKSLEFSVDGIGTVIARHAPAAFTDDECARADVLLHGHLHGHTPPIGALPRDKRHAYPVDPWIRRKLVDASIEALPMAPAPMRLVDLVAHLRSPFMNCERCV